MEEKRESEDLKIASLLHWLASLLVWQGWLLGSQGMLHGVSGGITERVGGMLGKSCLDRSVEEVACYEFREEKGKVICSSSTCFSGWRGMWVPTE